MTHSEFNCHVLALSAYKMKSILDRRQKHVYVVDFGHLSPLFS